MNSEVEELRARVEQLEAIVLRISIRYTDLATRFNSHTHGGVASGGYSTGAQNQGAATLDLVTGGKIRLA